MSNTDDRWDDELIDAVESLRRANDEQLDRLASRQNRLEDALGSLTDQLNQFVEVLVDEVRRNGEEAIDLLDRRLDARAGADDGNDAVLERLDDLHRSLRDLADGADVGGLAELRVTMDALARRSDPSEIIIDEIENLREELGGRPSTTTQRGLDELVGRVDDLTADIRSLHSTSGSELSQVAEALDRLRPASVSEVHDVVDELLAQRLDLAPAPVTLEQVRELVDRVAARLDTAPPATSEDVIEIVASLGEVGTASQLRDLANQVSMLASKAQFTAMRDEVGQQFERVMSATSEGLGDVAARLDRTASADQVDGLAERVRDTVTAADLDPIVDRVRETATAAQFESINEALGHLATGEDVSAVLDAVTALPGSTTIDELRAAIGAQATAEALGALHDTVRQARAETARRSDVDTLGRETLAELEIIREATLAPDEAVEEMVATLQSGLARMEARLTEAASSGVEDLIRSEIATLRNALSTTARQDDIRRVELAMEALPAPATASDLESVRDEVAAVGRAASASARTEQVAEAVDQLAQIIRSVPGSTAEDLVTSLRPLLVRAVTAQDLESFLDRLGERLEDDASAEVLAMLGALSERAVSIERIARSVAESDGSGDLDAVVAEFTTLERRLQAAIDGGRQDLADRLGSLDQRMASRDDLARLEIALDLSQGLATSEDIETLRDELAAIQRAASASAKPEDLSAAVDRMMSTLRGMPIDVSNAITSLLDRSLSAAASGAEVRALTERVQALATPVAAAASQDLLQSVAGRLGRVEHALGDIAGKLGEPPEIDGALRGLEDRIEALQRTVQDGGGLEQLYAMQDARDALRDAETRWRDLSEALAQFATRDDLRSAVAAAQQRAIDVEDSAVGRQIDRLTRNVAAVLQRVERQGIGPAGDPSAEG